MKFKINPGELRHLITIEKNTPIKNEDKLFVDHWEEVFKTKAKILNIRGEEFYIAQGQGSKVEKTFYIRFPKSCIITRKERVIYNNTAYNILYSNNIEEASRYLELKCEVVE